ASSSALSGRPTISAIRRRSRAGRQVGGDVQMATTTAVGTAELWKLTHEQRDKVGDMLASLDEADWDKPSLCKGWTVRATVAHMAEPHLMPPPAFMMKFAGSGFRFHSFSARGISRHAGQSPAELLAQYRATASRSTAPPGPKVTWLAEALIHG